MLVLVLVLGCEAKDASKGGDRDVCEVAQLVLLFGSFRCWSGRGGHSE